MSKTKGQTFQSNIVLETKPKRFGIVSEFVGTDCFDLDHYLLSCTKYKCALLMGQIREQTQKFGFIPVRCRNVCGTFAERLLLFCFDITAMYYPGGPSTVSLGHFDMHQRYLHSHFNL